MSKENYFIRKATKADATFIRSLIWQVRINPLGLKWRRFVVAMHEHGVRIGCAQLKIYKDDTRELASVAVVPHFRRQGVGAAMIQSILAGQESPIYLTCRESLVSFYERFGFQEIIGLDRMPPYYRKLKKFSVWLEKRNWVEPLAVMVWRGEAYRSTAPSE